MQIILTPEELAKAAEDYALQQIAIREGQTVTVRIEGTEDGDAIAIVDIGKAETKAPAPKTTPKASTPTKPAPAQKQAAPTPVEEVKAAITAKPEPEDVDSRPAIKETPAPEAPKQSIFASPEAPSAPAAKTSIFTSAESSAAPATVQAGPPPAGASGEAAKPNPKSLFANLVKPQHDAKTNSVGHQDD